MLRFVLLLQVLLLATVGYPALAQDAPSSTRLSQYVATRDGTRLAVDVVLPADLGLPSRLPTVLIQTRYWRNYELLDEDGIVLPEKFPEIKTFLTARGYAVVVADVRGSGASFGAHTQPFSEAEIRDGYDLVSWIVAQPWSNGRVGAIGDSYDGTTALQLLVDAHPAVKAVVPRFFEWDVFTDVSHPGGLANLGFLALWQAANAQYDANIVPCEGMDDAQCALVRHYVLGVLPASDDPSDLARAVAGHAGNIDVLATAASVASRDARTPQGLRIDDTSIRNRADRIDPGIPILWWAGWHDGATAQGALRAFRVLKNPITMIVGNLTHGGRYSSDPFLPLGTEATPSLAQQLGQAVAFFDAHLRDGAPPTSSTLRYAVLGSGEWHSTDRWPPDTRNERWYFERDGALRQKAPNGRKGADTRTMRLDTSTGVFNRWLSPNGSPIWYEDRREEDAKLLTYTSEPLSRARTLVGNPVVHMQLSSDVADPSLFVYLEAIAPDGRSLYLTEGVLATPQRELDVVATLEAATYRPSFRERDVRPFRANRRQLVTLALEPIAAQIPAGYRLRVAIGAHDDSVFAAPARAPVFTIDRNAFARSLIELPLLR